ncbi:MAG: hypothetical protein AAB443_02085 [Patescibacteria group bacterium]
MEEKDRGEKHLKSEQYYIDLYDLFTIKECLDHIRICQKAYQNSSNDEKLKDKPDEERHKAFSYMLNVSLYVKKGLEFQNKKTRLNEWIDRDQKFQDKYDNTSEPQDIRCPDCNSAMKTTFKTLENDWTDKPLRVLFFFDCTKCTKKTAVYDNGEIHESKPQLCPKCNKEVKVSQTRKGEVITWKTVCKSCGYKNTDVNDFGKSRAERKAKEDEDKALLEKYRSEFCLDEEKGAEAIELMEASEYASFVKEEVKREIDNPIYEKVSRLKRLSIADLEAMLSSILDEHKYTKLFFDKPEIDRHVIVPFSFQDSDPTRNKRTSQYDLQKLLKTKLEDTNWRLMNEGLSDRLGYISGKLKGYEREEDLLEIAGKVKEDKKQDFDPIKKSKYANHPYVQMAKIQGKQEAVENIRKRRLEKEPEGFFLEPTEGHYTCAICRETIESNKIWWNLDGLRCADCWRNIKEGIIPSLSWDHDNKIWIKEYEIKSEFSVQPATRGKLEREGILHGRKLKRPDGRTYCTVYLISENKEFLEKYPRKPERSVKLSWSEDGKKLVARVTDNK